MFTVNQLAKMQWSRRADSLLVIF